MTATPTATGANGARQADTAVDRCPRSLTWTDTDGRSCLRDTVVGDTQNDTRELVEAITEWGADRDAVIDAPSEGPATFTVCA